MTDADFSRSKFALGTAMGLAGMIFFDVPAVWALFGAYMALFARVVLFEGNSHAE